MPLRQEGVNSACRRRVNLRCRLTVGIRDSSKPLRRARRKSHTFRTLVAIAIEVQEPKGFGRIRLRRVPVASETYLLAFVREAVEPGARVHTDGSPAYRSLPEHGYVHRQRVHLGSEDPAHVSMPGVHRVASLLKRWLLGTHQGAVQPTQLDYY
ncbi:MAG: IS1595 family transposase, partial [Burkholderiales bacterium]